MKQLGARKPCPCGRTTGVSKTTKPLTYGECCGRWLEPSIQAAWPGDAESLMRSRYSAFVLERATYLQQSWVASHRPESIAFDPDTKWLGLDVRVHRQTGESAAEVEFVARQKPASGPAVRLHERSRFVRESGRWLYLDGEQL